MMVLGMMGMGGGARSVARAAGMLKRPAPVIYTPGFHRLAKESVVFASGDQQLIGRVEGTMTPTAGTLVDVADGAHRRIVAPSGCAIGGLSMSVVVFGCSGPDAYVIENLSSGQTLSILPSPLVVGNEGPLGVVGADWMPITGPPTSVGEYASSPTYYLNVRTGQSVPGFETVGSASYADLNSPVLVHTACRPVKISGASSGFEQVGPGRLVLLGRLAVHLGVGWNTQGILGVQMCGSRTIRHYRVDCVAYNSRLVLWDHSTSPEGIDAREGMLEGIDSQTGRRVLIAYPRQIHARGLNIELNGGIAINNRDIYLQTARGSQVWAAQIPSALR